MGNIIKILPLILILFTQPLHSQSIESLRHQIDSVIIAKNVVAGVAINGINDGDTIYLNADKPFPMQSVFKFPIGLAVLAEIDKGNLNYDTEIVISERELLPDLWSPIRKNYPRGGSIPITEILKYTVGESDNVGCDALLRLFDSPHAVEEYFVESGFENISIRINEETMQNNWNLQYKNWITPKESNRILRAFYENDGNYLSATSHDFIWEIMKTSQTGFNRIKGQLPDGTVVAHKTGSSGVNRDTGITAATNDMGIVFLPNGGYFFISVFITESTEDNETNERIISDIAKLAWDYFNAIK